MHDPETVAFEIGRFATIWHVDPQSDGSDHSCDYYLFGRRRRLSAKEKAISEAMWDLETLLDNRPHFPDSQEHLAFQPLKSAVNRLSMRDGFVYPKRWHFWHWKIQIHALQAFKRWAFSRCCKCGGRFKWGECPVTYSWNGMGPRWFRDEPNVFHSDCSYSHSGEARTSRGGTP